MTLRPALPAAARTPVLTTTFTYAVDPEEAAVADRTLGTLAPDPGPGSVMVRRGLHFTPAWDPAHEAQARVDFLGEPEDEARHAARMEVLRAARRRAQCGDTWRVQRLTVEVRNAAGDLLACETLSGVASDLETAARAELEADLHWDALRTARDWVILGLN